MGPDTSTEVATNAVLCLCHKPKEGIRPADKIFSRAGLLLRKSRKKERRPLQRNQSPGSENAKVKIKQMKLSVERDKAGELLSSTSTSSVTPRGRRGSSLGRMPTTSGRKRSKSCKPSSVQGWHPLLLGKDPLSSRTRALNPGTPKYNLCRRCLALPHAQFD